MTQDTPKMRSSDLLDDFTQFCVDNPELSFWRAIDKFKDKIFGYGFAEWDVDYSPKYDKVQKMDKGRP